MGGIRALVPVAYSSERYAKGKSAIDLAAYAPER